MTDVTTRTLELARNHPRRFQVGDAVITRVDEMRWADAEPATLYPNLDETALTQFGADLPPGSFDAGTSLLAQSIHAWLVQLPGRTVLIDAATGNGKHLPEAPVLDHLDEPWLARLDEAGVCPDDVDLVLLTHLHADHAGWLTHRDAQGLWVPTFRNARHVFSEIERRYGAGLADGKPAADLLPPTLGAPVRLPHASVYVESVQPVVAAGLAETISVDGQRLGDGFSFLPTPGHSVDHASIRLVSDGEEAVFLGDILHHPLQVYRPDLHSRYCEFPVPAHRSRLAMLAQCADSGATCFTTHFAESSAGFVSRRGDGFSWRFL